MKFGTCTAMDERNKAVYAAKGILYFFNFMFNYKNTKQRTRKNSFDISHSTEKHDIWHIYCQEP